MICFEWRNFDFFCLDSYHAVHGYAIGLAEHVSCGAWIRFGVYISLDDTRQYILFLLSLFSHSFPNFFFLPFFVPLLFYSLLILSFLSLTFVTKRNSPPTPPAG